MYPVDRRLSGPHSSLDRAMKRRTSHFCWESNIIHHVASNYTNWANPVPYTAKIWFYIFHEFTRFLHGPSQMAITIMLRFNRFRFLYFTFSLNLHFIFLVMTTKIYPILHFVVLRISYLMQSQMVQSKIHTTNHLMHSCKRSECTTWLH
jgi:hypothetical protein